MLSPAARGRAPEGSHIQPGVPVVPRGAGLVCAGLAVPPASLAEEVGDCWKSFSVCSGLAGGVTQCMAQDARRLIITLPTGGQRRGGRWPGAARTRPRWGTGAAGHVPWVHGATRGPLGAVWRMGPSCPNSADLAPNCARVAWPGMSRRGPAAPHGRWCRCFARRWLGQMWVWGPACAAPPLLLSETALWVRSQWALHRGETEARGGTWLVLLHLGEGRAPSTTRLQPFLPQQPGSSQASGGCLLPASGGAGLRLTAWLGVGPWHGPPWCGSLVCHGLRVPPSTGTYGSVRAGRHGAGWAQPAVPSHQCTSWGTRVGGTKQLWSPRLVTSWLYQRSACAGAVGDGGSSFVLRCPPKLGADRVR